MEHEHELVDMWVLQFETLYGKLNHKQEKIKSLQNLHRQTDLWTRGSFHENGQCNYIKILNYIFVKVIMRVFHEKDNEGIT
jgi:hypothetical protein